MFAIVLTSNEQTSETYLVAKSIKPMNSKYSKLLSNHIPVVISVIAKLKISTLYELRKRLRLRRKTAINKPLLKIENTAMIPMDTLNAMCSSPESSGSFVPVMVSLTILKQLREAEKMTKIVIS